MDRYHSIVGTMVSYHWKPLKNHRVQWLLDYKTIETLPERLAEAQQTQGQGIEFKT